LQILLDTFRFGTHTKASIALGVGLPVAILSGKTLTLREAAIIT